MKNLRSYVNESKFFSLFFKTRFYAELGETQFAKFIPDLSKYLIPLMFLQQYFGFKLSIPIMVMGFTCMLTFFYGLGLMYKFGGFYDKEIWTDWRRHPVGHESLTKIRDIHKKVGCNEESDTQTEYI